jgi:hypothetical protein
MLLARSALQWRWTSRMSPVSVMSSLKANGVYYTWNSATFHRTAPHKQAKDTDVVLRFQTAQNETSYSVYFVRSVCKRGERVRK